MTPASNLSGGQMESAMTPEYLRALGVIHMAVSAGPIIFAVAVVFVMSVTREITPVAQDIVLMNVLSLANLLIMASAWFVGTFVFQRLCSNWRTVEEGENGQNTQVQRALGSMRNGLIVRLAMIEASAIFGIAVCLIGVMRGVLPKESMYWFNMAPLAVLFGYSITNFPSKSKIISIFEAFP
jgi:F0F1-type ATP synthase membrane subunit c/vacuolar-type H+-ATPase subunit K